MVTKYPLMIFHEVLKKILQTMDKCPISTMEFRNFVLSKDYDDSSVGDVETFRGAFANSVVKHNFPQNFALFNRKFQAQKITPTRN